MSSAAEAAALTACQPPRLARSECLSAADIAVMLASQQHTLFHS